jgi:hypothetical protein
MTKPCFFCAQAMNMNRGFRPVAWLDDLCLDKPSIRKIATVYLYAEIPYVFVAFKKTRLDYGHSGINLPDGKVTLCLCRL